MLEVEPIAANRQHIADAPARQAVRRSIPTRSRRVASHGRLRSAKRRIVAEPGRDGRCAPNCAGSRTQGGGLPLSASVGLEANPAGLDGARCGPPVYAYAALCIVAEP